MKTRCAWPGTDPLYTIYHDIEWGVPLHDDRKLFECIVLQGAQAGLSWLTVLKKRGNYRKAFDHFDTMNCKGPGKKGFLCGSEVLRVIFGQPMWGSAHEVKQHD